MRVKLDENQPLALLAVLREAGHEAETAADEGLASRPDAELVARCQAERRAILTFDLDLANLREYPPEQYSGLLVLRLKSQAVHHVVRIVRRILPLLASEPVEGHLWLIDEEQVRIR
jgi:predicted nuclease of predicted toxin-antitoxin system